MNYPDPENLGQKLGADGYLQARLAPPFSDIDHIILQDVLKTVRRFAEGASGELLDFGSGGSPYRGLFKGVSKYRAADISPGSGIDFIIDADGRIDLPDGSFDVVLSTQVLEHVPDPVGYLREAWRLLRPGGRMLVTTHGLFIEHGCPYDFRRWTPAGLVREGKLAGFEVVDSWKLSAGARGAIQMLHYSIRAIRVPEHPSLDKIVGVFRRLHRGLGIRLGNRFASKFESLGQTSGDHPGELFIGVAMELRKPTS